MSPFCQVSLGGRRPRGVTVAVQKSFIIRCSFSPPSRSIPPRRRVNNTHLFQYYHINVKVQLSPNGKTKSDVAFKKCSAAVRATQIRIYEFMRARRLPSACWLSAWRPTAPPIPLVYPVKAFSLFCFLVRLLCSFSFDFSSFAFPLQNKQIFGLWQYRFIESTYRSVWKLFPIRKLFFCFYFGCGYFLLDSALLSHFITFCMLSFYTCL